MRGRVTVDGYVDEDSAKDNRQWARGNGQWGIIVV
jgi:hypothetical protein